MPKIKINNTEYDTDNWPEEAKQQLQMLAMADAEIKRLQAQLAIAQTARNAYLKAMLDAAGPGVPAGDTIKL